jgi:hypothetical protein
LARLHEGPTRRIKESPLQHLGPPETHLSLRRMNVAIDEFEIHLDVKHTGWVLTAFDNAQVSFSKRLLDCQTVNGPTVENHELEKPVPTSLSWTCQKSAKPHSVSRKIADLQKLG